MKPFKAVAGPLTWRTGIAFALGAAVCFHIAHTNAEFTVLRWFALPYLVLLVQLARLKTTRLAFYFGLATGLLCVGPQLAWFWNIFGPAAVPLWMILAVWIALFVALAHGAMVRFGLRWACLLIPFLWTGLEYFRSELYPLKFSWLNVGYALAAAPIQPVSAIGMYGLGFGAAICAALTLTWRWKFAAAAVSLLIAFAMVLSTHRIPAGKGTPIRIAGVQLEFPSEAQIRRSLNELLARFPECDVVVLSEYTLDGPVPKSLLDWCRKNNRHLIVGGKDPAPNGDFYNTAFVIGPAGDIVFKQVKSVPIQFFRDGLPAPRQALWESPWGKIGICICYDLSYTRVTDRLVDLGAQLLIVPTMDVADWGKRQHELHALVAPVRAAEYRIPIFRLASSGISQAIDAEGAVLNRAGFPGENEMLNAELQLPAAGTRPLDRILGPVAVGLSLLTAIGLGISTWRERRRVRFSQILNLAATT